MSAASDRVRKAMEDARSGDDLASDPMAPPGFPGEPPLESPLDRDTLDEMSSTQMGPMYESRRRDAT